MEDGGWAMSETHPDDLAFPGFSIDGYSQYGLTKREIFAMVMTAAFRAADTDAILPLEMAAELGRKQSDALIAELCAKCHAEVSAC